tara:strand:- start:282 stop:683 length:402 start_codon:yes stop_codon:yes gene_type:complete
MTNYNTNLVLTYNLLEDDDDSEITENLYRSQFLQTFNLENWDDDIINKTTETIYKKYCIDIKFREIFKFIKTEKTIFTQIIIFYGENYSDIDLFKMLYNYETFYLLHKYICDLENKNIENNEIINKIINIIKE